MRIAIIPAKKDSQRFPGKNTVNLHGQPLYAHTLNAVVASGLFNRIILSTNDEQVVRREENNAAVELHNRPQHLADDKSTVAEVCLDILSAQGIHEGSLGVFLPTSPLRTAQHIREAWEIFSAKKIKTISVKSLKVPRHFIFGEAGDTHTGERIFSGNNTHHSTNSKLAPRSWIPNGAIFFTTIEELHRTGSFYADRISLYKMDEQSSVDIDTELDYKIAKMIWDEQNS
jgi:CMP-N-acetylneuraminic acid synthetase